MARTLDRKELMLLIEELDRGEVEPRELEELVISLELAVSDTEAVDILQDDELTASDIADQLLGYSERNA